MAQVRTRTVWTIGKDLFRSIIENSAHKPTGQIEWHPQHASQYMCFSQPMQTGKGEGVMSLMLWSYKSADIFLTSEPKYSNKIHSNYVWAKGENVKLNHNYGDYSIHSCDFHQLWNF